jgi:hypothetical protein
LDKLKLSAEIVGGITMSPKLIADYYPESRVISITNSPSYRIQARRPISNFQYNYRVEKREDGNSIKVQKELTHLCQSIHRLTPGASRFP